MTGLCLQELHTSESVKQSAMREQKAEKTRLKEWIETLLDIDFGVFLIGLLLTGLGHQVLSRGQTIRALYVSDASLWNEFKGDSIHTGTLFLLFYFVLSPIIYVLEKRNLAWGNLEESTRKRFALRLAFGMWIATMIAIMTTELVKGYVGRLRPSFAVRCLGHGPPYDESTLSKVMHSDAECSASDKSRLRDGRRSFPSGHAALGFAGTTYAQLCLGRFAMRQGRGQAVISMCAGWVLMLFGIWVGASRVYDHAHHASDVAVGYVVGAWCSGVQFWYVCGRNGGEMRELGKGD